MNEIRSRIRDANATLPETDYPFPVYVIVEPTNTCNLRCVMCPSHQQTRPRGIMAMSTWTRIMDEIAEKSPETTVWPAVMGEALLAGDRFIEMLAYARDRGIGVIWNTNAVLLTDRWISEVAATGLKEIIVGLDATTPESYAQIRRGGDFQAAVTNVLKLLDASKGRTRITVQFIEQDINRAERDEFIDFWLSKGAVVKIRPQLGWGKGVATPKLLLGQQERVGRCPWLVRTVSIHWNGVVVQCDGDWNQEWPAGDLATNSIEEIWNGELAKRRTRHRNMDFDFDPCRNCNDWQAGLSRFYYPEGEPRDAKR